METDLRRGIYCTESCGDRETESFVDSKIRRNAELKDSGYSVSYGLGCDSRIVLMEAGRANFSGGISTLCSIESI